jgi:lipopolysaccharide biosynthesis protein
VVSDAAPRKEEFRTVTATRLLPFMERIRAAWRFERRGEADGLTMPRGFRVFFIQKGSGVVGIESKASAHLTRPHAS